MHCAVRCDPDMVRELKHVFDVDEDSDLDEDVMYGYAVYITHMKQIQVISSHLAILDWVKAMIVYNTFEFTTMPYLDVL